jgi:hypothetical protein
VPPEANEHTSRPEKSGKPWVSRLGPYVVGVGAFGGIGAFATWGLFVTLNGALDSGPATQRSYTVAEFHKDCGGARAKDKSYYLQEPRGADGGEGPIQARVNCSEDEGLPVDGGGTVPVGGEVVVEIKPGAFGEPWQAGYPRGSLGRLWWFTRTTRPFARRRPPSPASCQPASSTSTPPRMSVHVPLDRVWSGVGGRVEGRRSWCATSASYAGFLLRLDASGT